MAVYKCEVCGEIYDESCEPIPFNDLPEEWRCPLCNAPKSSFRIIDAGQAEPKAKEACGVQAAPDAAIDAGAAIGGGSVMDAIHAMAATGSSVDEPMDTSLPVPKFDEILILGAQLAVLPLERDAPVNLRTVIGRSAKRPMVLDMPVFVSHMSFGALSGKAKKALAAGAAAAGTAVGSGEGGALPEERSAAAKYIFEYVPNRYGENTDVIRKADAIEIKIGQGTKPGMGGHLPAIKVTPAISIIRGRPLGQEIWSPAGFSEVRDPDGLKNLVDRLRADSGGSPIGVKIAAGRIEDDLNAISLSGCDFITIDGRGGATGSTNKFIKDSASVPTVYAVSRARKYMDAKGMKQELIVTGGLRTSGDIYKAIAMGADAVALASAAMMALGCRRYRACHTGNCPMGIATQDPELEKRLDAEAGARRVANFFNALAGELRSLARATGLSDIHDASPEDLCTISSEMSEHTGIRHAGDPSR
ncbi:MAG: alpha-hydroxy-acid oxidizing protein [Candidatus Methanoplasma sp.]|jgi:glutamate synthase domain-containing protein 2/rubredoxin|nr:alpha-hydroxy-acid oxidizing protein [Candidatus Methanoplasma sp.]